MAGFRYLALLTYPRQAEKDLEQATQKLDDVLEKMVPRASKREIMAWVEERYQEAYDSYHDFLSTYEGDLE